MNFHSKIAGLKSHCKSAALLSLSYLTKVIDMKESSKGVLDDFNTAEVCNRDL